MKAGFIVSQFETERTYELILKAQSGDVHAKEQLVTENMGLVYRAATRFYGRGVDNEDLHQIGAIGLILAIDKFDVSYNVRFSTYAVPIILGEIKRFFRDNGPIKVSRSIKKTASDIARVSEQLQIQTGKAPGVLEIATALSLSIDEITQALEATAPIESICASVYKDGEQTLSDTLSADAFEPETLERLDIQVALLSLSPREQLIVSMRYGREKSQSEVAKKLGISQVQVSRLERKILTSLKSKLKYEKETAFS